ncbi:uncharacterized protein KIAA1671 homolog [Anomaloglossus baeobatrachus]|uniref:uncharacterized protein KIAA1671 homolog n=1 Tax=Anomaloglossus baeobatrachus TaxID=238106 RepID=UPI003F4FEC81
MSDMATKVELSTRTTRSDILNEAKPSRTYISPLSDASNKATDTNISTSLITDDNIRNLSKTVNMLNTGMKPRLSPKPFSRDKTPEGRTSIGIPFTLSGDLKKNSDVPFQATTSISLSGSTKSNESERIGRRIFTSPSQASTDEDHGNKSEMFSPTVPGRRQNNSSWPLGTNKIGESKPNPQTEESKVTSKPPMMSRKPELSQQEKMVPSYSRRTFSDSVDETKEFGDKNVEAAKPDNIDSLTVRAQLRQKRRPVSAVFLDSNEPSSDQKIVDESKKWNRRPLSEDLTSLFESRALGNKKEKPSEETKENRPFKKSFLDSITDEQSNSDTNEGGYRVEKNIASDTRTDVSGNSVRKTYSFRMEKDKPMEILSNKQQPIADVGENEGIMKLSANINTQSSKCLPDGSSGDVKKLVESRISPGIMKRRISLSKAPTSSSEDTEATSHTEDKSTANSERKTRSFASDMGPKPGTEWTTSISPIVSTDLTMKFANSPSKLDLKSERPNDERRGSFSSQEYIAQKEKKELENSSLLEEKTFRPRRSFRRNNDPVRIEDSTEVPKDRRQYSYRDKLYNAKTEAFEENNMNSTQVDKSVKTVKATLFEHNVERHNAPEIYQSGSLMATQPPKSMVISECVQTKPDSSTWSEWFSGDNVQSIAQSWKDLKMKDNKFGEKHLDTVSSTDVGNLPRMTFQHLKVDENKRVEPRFEVVQAVTERVLSESIELAPEDKAVTLRSRRSFHNRDRGLGKDIDEREGISLQRSKSDYWKKNVLNSPQENSQGKSFSRGTDQSFERRNSSTMEKDQLVNTPSDGFYKVESVFTRNNKIPNNDIDFEGFQEKSFESNNRKEKTENTFGNNDPEYSHFGSSSKSKGHIKTSFRSFSQQSDKSVGSRITIGKDSEKDIKSEKEDLTSVSVRDDFNSQGKGYKKQTSFNQFHSQGSSTRNINKEESNDFTNIMLNKEIEQMKRELVTSSSKKEPDDYPKKDFKEESKGDIMSLKSNDYFQDREKIGDKMHRTSELYRYEHDNLVTAAKDPSPIDKRATYFAVTGVDGKRQRKDSENQISSNTSLTSDEPYYKRSGRMGLTNSDSFSQEVKNTEKDIGTSHLSKGFKTSKNAQVLQENLIEKPEKPPERHSVIDIDALLKRQKQKLSIEDKGPSYLDAQTRPLQKSHLLESEKTQESNAKGSPLKLDDTYKSKVLDIDSFMADYNPSQRKDKENKARDDDYDINKWERSRSLRENVSKGWRDPSGRHFTSDEYKYEAFSSRYTSPQETTSTKHGLKQGLSNSSILLDNFNPFSEGRHEKNVNKGREEDGILPRPNDSQTTSTLELSGKTFNYTTQSTQSFESTAIDPRTTSHMHRRHMLTKVSGDDQNENRVVEHESENSKLRGSIPEEKTQPLSEDQKPTKASDLISIMLANKEKRMERHRARQSIPVDLPQEPKTAPHVTWQEWTHSETKEFYKKEEIKPRSTRIQEKEFTTDLLRKKSRHNEYTSLNEDHVKQCFSRSSTSNKDTDSLVQETDRQYGTWNQDKQQPEESFVQESSSYDNISCRKQQSHSRLSSLSHTETDQHDSITEVHDGSLDRSSMDLDSTDGTASTPSFHEAKAPDFSFMDQTSVLDSTALKNRVQLSRKSQRRAPSQSQRRSRLLLSSSQLAVIEDTDSPWMFTDTTEDKPEKPEIKDEVDEAEEKPQRSSLPSQRMPMFPGMDHSTLMAQLRKRQETESGSESSTQPSSPQTSAQPSRSPKSPLPQGTLGVKLLPTSADIQERGASESPQWLKELKSKKRQSQYENHS